MSSETTRAEPFADSLARMSEDRSTHVRVETADRVTTLTLDRAGKKNAITRAMYSRLAEALHEAEADANARVVLLQGNDALFTAGNDLGDFQAQPPVGPDSPVISFLHALVGFPKPIVAAVAGPAIGIGTTLLLHCDLVYAAPDTVFQLPFTQLGLCPEGAASVLLPLLAGRQRASELLLLGARFDAATAERIGLVNAIVPAADLLAHAKERALALAALPPASVRLTKGLVLEGQRALVLAALERETGHFIERLRSPEAAEAMTAFFERRKPDFSRFE